MKNIAKNFVRFAGLAGLLMAATHSAHANSVLVADCTATSIVVQVDVSNPETAQQINFRDTTNSSNRLEVGIGAGSSLLEGNFAEGWSGSNLNLEVFLSNAEGGNQTTPVRCPAN